MNILVIGGTKFVGRHIVEAALLHGHRVTLFNRGTNREVFPELELIQGDRVKDANKIGGRKWDAVIDTCGYHPKTVRKTVKAIKDYTDIYTFISTASVYKNFACEDMIDEDAEVLTLTDEEIDGISETAERTPETYGPLKYYCEQVVYDEMEGRGLVIRPGLIVGPHDPTDRFTYWANRLAEDREILAPGRPERKIQFIDARDLAEWTIQMVERQVVGTYNAAGPALKLMMATFLEKGKMLFNNPADITWVSESFLKKNHVGPWMELPLWIPETYALSEERPPANGDIGLDNFKAMKEGLRFRPYEETLKDTHDWFRQENRALSDVCLNATKEQTVLKKWMQAASV
ncbi:NAD-dependent epimerase/dehydratase family protein [Pseudalkalibacillus berkeleyi]|uniref:NAD-dependent epimerase/dehydratase family protein n=1 Tax=Pseudalkalibacillus berkeleyi TaxID=1069813 RepID=A0ABS9GUN4_9BACL|nr:NAD-dependent epimerase/dehydratase family protein [Pseudalkalibacillus berkeleyi]MCF6136389.1 NAD-dependent epimerase/dehydratase family protein [Pseudalkalibacillus berkeleyi]